MIIKKILNKEILDLKNLLNKLEYSNLENFNVLLKNSIKSIKKNRKVIFFGNGGSAADAQHLATELTVRFKKNRKPIPALALTTDGSVLTAIGNDFKFNDIFSRQIEAIGNKGDICIALTTSGNSKNLIQAIKMAKKKKILTFCFSGNNGGKIKKFTDYSIIIPSKDTDKIQVIELFLGQVLCGLIENSI